MSQKISIIIPAYNASKLISRCLDSIINQTYKNIEIIIVNDGSTDNTASVLEQYSIIDNRIRIITQENKGCNTSRKAGYTKSTGEYLFNIDADDYLELNAIELLVKKAIETEADIILAYHYKCTNTKKEIIKNIIPSEQTKINIVKEFLKAKIKGYSWGRLYKRDLLVNVQIPPYTPLGDDVITNLKILLENNITIALVEKPLYYYIVHGNNITFSTKTEVIEGTFKHIIIVDEIVKKLSFYNEIQNEHKAFNCRAWIVYNRMNGENTKNKQYNKAFYKENFTSESRSFLAFHQIIELYCYKINRTFGKRITILMMKIKKHLL